MSPEAGTHLEPESDRDFGVEYYSDFQALSPADQEEFMKAEISDEELKKRIADTDPFFRLGE